MTCSWNFEPIILGKWLDSPVQPCMFSVPCIKEIAAMHRLKSMARSAGIVLSVLVACTSLTVLGQNAPTPFIEQGQPVDWWFVFKFNSAAFPHCGGTPEVQRVCPFGGTPQPYPRFKNNNYRQQ